MRAFLLSLSAKYQIAMVVGLTILLAFCIANIFTLFFDFHQLQSNTDLISAIYQVLGTTYAILLTFTLWGVWQNYCIAEASVQNEANALVDLIHIFEASGNWHNNNIRLAALAYTKTVVEHEWAALKNINDDAINIRERSHTESNNIVLAVQEISPQTDREVAIFSHTLTMLGTWLDARRTRLLMAKGNSAKALWPLLLTGGFVLFAFHGLFVANTLGIWMALLFGTSLIIGLTFYLIFSLDCPFSGAPSIDVEPFKLATSILSKK